MSSALCLGTGWPAWIKMRPRAPHLQALHEKTTRLSLEFSRQYPGRRQDDCGDTIGAGGVADDYLARHSRTRGADYAHHRSADMQPVMTFAASKALRERHVSGI